MNEQPVTQSSSKSLGPLFAILIIVILVLVGYIIYDKFSMKKDPEAFSDTSFEIKDLEEKNDTPLYQNAGDNFKINMPSQSSVDNPNVLADGSRNYYVRTKVGEIPPYPYLRNINVGIGACPTGITTTINGVTFIRTDETGNAGGMESGSVDSFYCTMRGEARYTFAFFWSYPRHEAAGPDRSIATQEFDREMRSLNFQFIR